MSDLPATTPPALDGPTSFGVAISIPEPHGSTLQDKRASFGDPLAAGIPSHITLLPPDELPGREIACLAADLEKVAAGTAPFDVALRGTGTFRPVSPVVFVALSQGVPEAERLASELRRSIGAPEPQFPFHPHVTVAHHLDDTALDRAYAELADFTCDFRATEFALYLHDDAAGWTPTLTFPFLGGAAAQS